MVGRLRTIIYPEVKHSDEAKDPEAKKLIAAVVLGLGAIYLQVNIYIKFSSYVLELNSHGVVPTVWIPKWLNL